MITPECIWIESVLPISVPKQALFRSPLWLDLRLVQAQSARDRLEGHAHDPEIELGKNSHNVHSCSTGVEDAARSKGHR